MPTINNIPFKSRLAPTPSGYLHMGNVGSFLLAWVWAKLNNGQLLLRIDDVDAVRCRNEYLQDIFDTFQFLGIDHNEGPTDVEDFVAHFTQSKRLPHYRAAIQKLLGNGQLYACTCSRKQLAAANNGQFYPHFCRENRLPLDTPGAALRILMETDASITFGDEIMGSTTINLTAQNPDFIVRQKDGLPSYQLCSLVDDVLFGITHIVRGEDLLVSTASQLYLANLLAETSFQQIRFLHHPLQRNEQGEKLSKSAGSTSIHFMRSQGCTSAHIFAQLGQMFGINNLQASTANQLLQFIIENGAQEIGIFAKLKTGC